MQLIFKVFRVKVKLTRKDESVQNILIHQICEKRMNKWGYSQLHLSPSVDNKKFAVHT